MPTTVGDVRFPGGKRTYGSAAARSANDPKRTSTESRHHPGAQSPGGRPDTVGADIEMTKPIIEIAPGPGIAVLDHIIVGKDGHASLKALMLIPGWLGRADYTGRSIDVN